MLKTAMPLISLHSICRKRPMCARPGTKTSRFAGVGLWLILVAFASACGSESEGSLPQGRGARLQLVVSGLSAPLYLTAPPGDLSRLFIVEQTGAVRIVRDGVLLPTPFLNISDRLVAGGEQGLLGLAFDPDYATNGRFVVHYTDLAGDTRVSSFQVSTDPDIADAGTEQTIYTADQPYSNHNGGQVLFGPDGYLYIGLGDGGSANDPEGRGQDLTEPLGSILRLDIRTATPYSIPPDNPFVAQAGALPEIWNYGLRNPWRFSFDRATGDLYIADVGQNRVEEVDVANSGSGGGANYGWSIMEGAFCLSGNECDQTNLVLPVYQYEHDQGCSITGGYVYRGSAILSLQGVYFYGDYCQGWVRSWRNSGGAVVELTDWPTLRPGGQLTSFGEDAAGELYVISANGNVFKVIPDP